MKAIAALAGVFTVTMALAIPAPEWFESGVIYQISLRTFTEEGTFAAAAEKLEHVRSTGANIVYLTPFVEMDGDMDRSGWSKRQIASGFESPKNPYRISDYDTVDPEYGTEADAKRFVERAHALDLKVMFDLVYLHCGPNNVITNTIPDAFARNPDGSIKTTYWHFPYLNFESAATREYLLANMKRFVTEYGADGFRCDVGDQVPEEFWNWAFGEVRKVKPDLVTLNEGIKASHVRRAFNANYDWNWSYALREAVQQKEGRCPLAERIRREQTRAAACPADSLIAVFIENHDLATDSGTGRIDAQLPPEAVNAAFAGLFLSRAIPVIWNGNELADGLPTTFFAPVGHPGLKGRTVHWELSDTPQAKRRLALLQELARLRRDVPAFARGTMTFVDNTAGERVLTFVREAPGCRRLVAVNLSPTPAEIVCEGRTLALAPWEWTVRDADAVAAASGIEADPPAAGTDGASTRADSRPHLRVTAWDLHDRTDGVGELVQKREWLLLPGTTPVEITANVVDVQDVVTGRGTVYLRLCPLPGSRNWEGPDFRTTPGGASGVEVVDRPCRTVTIPYEGGEIGRRTALLQAQRRIRPVVPGRDGLFLSNTWGDRNRDARLCESFMFKEIEAGAKLGVEVIQIDDGWQKGRTANSSEAKGKGVWEGYWASDPAFWTPDPVRFPNGLGPLVAAAAGKGMRFGLWFGPDSSHDAANWERDADLLLDYHRTLGIDYFKIDSLKTRSETSLGNQTALFDKVLKASGGKVVFDLDVTAERRPGYFGLPEIGPVFVENRYTDWHKYWPHQTLRQFWSLCDVLDPVRLRMEILNPLRNREKYANDPLAPSAWPIESVFASVMLGSPLGWFEASGLDPQTVERLAPFVATWKRHRDRLHAGVVHPIGAKPDGVSWTGFAVRGERDLDVILFRELAAGSGFTFDMNPYLGSIPPPSSEPTRRPCEVLSPRGEAAVLTDGSLTVRVDDPLDFVWVRVPLQNGVRP